MRFSGMFHKIAGAIVLTIMAMGTSGASAQDLWGDMTGSSSRSVIPFSAKYPPGQIIVSFSDRRLYYVKSRGEAIAYAIAIPRQLSKWQGVLNVSQKRVNPAWTPTPTMIRENPRLPSWVPGGHPMNPLGVRALYLGDSMYRIHGTDAPWTIGQDVSKGCIRMFNKDVIDLYDRVNVGAKVTVTYQRYASAG